MDKKQIRKTMKAQRAKLTKNEVLTYSSGIWRKIYNTPMFKSAQTIFLYSSIGNEVDTVEIATKALAMGKKIAYPVTNTTDYTMEFYRINSLSELVTVKSGSFSLKEPNPDSHIKTIPNSATLMIVPGLAFDKEFYRTGYGGGFYDKYIGQYPTLITLGVCYAFQVIDYIPREAHDHPVGLLMTEAVKP